MTFYDVDAQDIQPGNIIQLRPGGDWHEVLETSDDPFDDEIRVKLAGRIRPSRLKFWWSVTRAEKPCPVCQGGKRPFRLACYNCFDAGHVPVVGRQAKAGV